MNLPELDAILPIVQGAARAGAALALEGFRRHPVAEHKGDVDLVTSFDRASEALIRERLSAALPFAIVGEESGGQASGDGPVLFVDPIDGTTNFVHGHPFWCVSIGLVVAGVPRLGVVVAPLLGVEWYGLHADGGAHLAVRRTCRPGSAEWTEEPCSVSGVERVEDALLATGFPYDRRTSADNNFDAFVAIKRRCQAVRRCGSAAIDLCMVADGTYDGYWERKLQPWDIAGGIAVVRGAGGRVTERDGSAGYLSTGHLVATNGLVHDALLAALAEVRPASGGW